MTYYYAPPPPNYYAPPPPNHRSSMRAWVLVGILAVVGVIGLVIIAVVMVRPSQSPHAPSSAKPTVVYTESEQQYLRSLHARGVDESDSRLVAAGRQVCDDLSYRLQNAQDPDVVGELRMIMQTRGWSNWTASAVVARAVTNLCPRL